MIAGMWGCEMTVLVGAQHAAPLLPVPRHDPNFRIQSAIAFATSGMMGTVGF